MKKFFKKHKKGLIWGGAVAVVIIILITLFLSGNGNGWKAAAVTRADLTEEVEIAGTVESNSYAELGFEVSGKVTSVPVKVGDVVERGQLLVQLDSADLYADLQDAQALVTIKRAELENAEVNLDDIRKQQDVLVDNAKRKLLTSDLEAVPVYSTYDLDAPLITGTYTGGEGEYRISIENNEVNATDLVRVTGIESYEGPVEDVRANPLGTKGLYIQLLADSNEYTNTNWRVTIPNPQGAEYTANLNAYEAAVEARTVAIREAERSLAEGTGEDSIAKAELAQAQARVNRILAQIAQRSVRAPFTGTVASVEIAVGEIASSGSMVAAVVSDGDYEISLDVPEIDVSKLEIGNIVTILLDAFGERTSWEGEVTAISQAETYVDGVPVYETIVVFKETDERIRSGLSATVSIVTDTRMQVLAVPAEYLDRDETGQFVEVVVGNPEDHKTEKRYVQTGLRGADGLVEILEGLSMGEMVAVKE